MSFGGPTSDSCRVVFALTAVAPHSRCYICRCCTTTSAILAIAAAVMRSRTATKNQASTRSRTTARRHTTTKRPTATRSHVTARNRKATRSRKATWSRTTMRSRTATKSYTAKRNRAAARNHTVTRSHTATPHGRCLPSRGRWHDSAGRGRHAHCGRLRVVELTHRATASLRRRRAKNR